eukprot:GFUD01030870.1.p1 GENE.GFUD01030870.1~~GFUD01030870.1.p1  ORF type:complete len:353 (+),score=74.22 GFUD01030870.1:64-1122(+)
MKMVLNFVCCVFLLAGSIDWCEGKIEHHAVKSVDCEDANLSAKAKRLFCANMPIPIPTTSPVTKEPPTLATPPTIHEEIFVKPEGPVTFEIPGTTESTNWLEDDLPECSDLMEGFDDMDDCKNSTEPEPIIRWRDMVFERLINQTWEDTQKKINQNSSIGGFLLDPLMVEKVVGKSPTLDISQSSMVYSADLKMWNIEVHGLSTIYLSEVLVTRAQNLYDLDMKVVFSFEKLSANGIYNLNGTLGGWFGTSFTSDGDRTFDVDIVNATITPRVRLDTTDPSKIECGKNGDVLITDIEIPFNYDDISINFANLGYAYNAVINGLSIFILKTQEEALVTFLKDSIKEQVNSLIC